MLARMQLTTATKSHFEVFKPFFFCYCLIWLFEIDAMKFRCVCFHLDFLKYYKKLVCVLKKEEKNSVPSCTVLLGI